MDLLHTHNIDAEDLTIPRDARTFSVSFAGYDKEKGRDDIVYVSVNSYWEDVEITLPQLHMAGSWYLSVDTYGDEKGRYCYPEGEEKRVIDTYVLRPRTVAVFTARSFYQPDREC